MGSNYSKLAKLVALKVIAQNFSDNIVELVKANTKWLPAFAAALIAEVDTIGNNLIGKKAKTALFEATDNVKNVITPAKKDITTLKIQIDVNFKSNPARRKVILDDLGYTSFYKKVTARNQLATIGLLSCVKRSLDTYKEEILETGTPPDLLERVAGYATVVSHANMVQEQLKTTTKEITVEASAELDTLYNKVIGICLVAADFYKNNPVKKELFTFSKVIDNLGYIPEAEPKTAAPKA